MRVSLTLIVFAACLALCACAESSCDAKITIKARDSSWNDGATTYQIYDLTVTNNGTCVLISIAAFLSYSERGYVSESWNFNPIRGTFSGYESHLTPGKSFYGAGFVLANSSAPVLSGWETGCPESCNFVETTSAPSTSAPSTTTAPSTKAPSTIAPSTIAPSTTAPSTKAPSTIAPSTIAPSTIAPSTKAPSTSAPTSNPSTAAPTSNPSTTAPATCAVTASVTRDNYSWMDAQGRNNSVYRLSIKNNGPCALQYYSLSFNYLPGTIMSVWNLQSSIGGYLVTGYGPKLAPGAEFNAAGMIIANGPDKLTITPYGSTCAC